MILTVIGHARSLYLRHSEKMIPHQQGSRLIMMFWFNPRDHEGEGK